MSKGSGREPVVPHLLSAELEKSIADGREQLEGELRKIARLRRIAFALAACTCALHAIASVLYFVSGRYVLGAVTAGTMLVWGGGALAWRGRR